MRTELIASSQLGSNPVFAVGSAASDRVYAACGTTLYVLSYQNVLQRTIYTYHSYTITSLAVNSDGYKIATVGLDGYVVFIDPSGTALFKYTHGSEIQSCAFSPNGEHFLTCADGDIGIYAQGAQKVQKYKIDGVARCCAWSPSGTWFCVGTQAGEVICMDVAGQIFNKIDIQAPVWTILIENDSAISTYAPDAEPDEQEQNDVGIYKLDDVDDKQASKAAQPQDSAALAFIQKNNVGAERILIASWDYRYRVLDPSALGHSGALAAVKPALFYKKKRQQSYQSQILLAETKLPFVPLSMQLVGRYVAIGGVGGKLVFLSAETGAHLIDIFYISDADPYVIAAPRVRNSISAADEQRYKDALRQRYSTGGTLSWFGFNQIWIYTLIYVKPNYFFLGLQNGVVLALRFQFGAVDALYKNFYAVRDGLTSIVVKNLTTQAEARLDVGAYVYYLAIFYSRLAVLSGYKLDIYELIDPSTERMHVESVLRLEQDQARRGRILLRAEKSHYVKFTVCQILLAERHFILVGADYVAALGLDGAGGTSWRMRGSRITCARVVGGVPGEENLLVGTNDGRVLMLKIGNRFPVEAVKHDFPITAVDISAQRDMISILDSYNTLSVFDLFGSFRTGTQPPRFQITRVRSSAFDLVLPNVLSYSSDGKLNICINGSIVYTYAAPRALTVLAQNGNVNYNYSFTGDVMGFSLDCIYQTEIPVTPNVTHHVKRCYAALSQNVTEFDFSAELSLAVAAAALGAPASYWREIAVAALFCGVVDLAREALSSIGNVRVLKTLSEIAPDAENARFQYIALALSLCGHFADAAMLFAAAGDLRTASELLFFTRADGMFYVGPNSSTISAITQKLIKELLGERAADVQAPPNLALYYKLGTSDEDIARFRAYLIESRRAAQYGNFPDFLQIYEQDPSQNTYYQQYSYSADFRIILRRQLVQLCQTPQQRAELISRHSRFLESVQDWQAASSSWLDAGDPEKAVQVLISNKQTNTLLRLVRMLPPLTKQPQNDTEADDFAYEPAKEDAAYNTLLRSAFKHVLLYFERNQDFDSALYIAQRLGDAAALLRLLVAQELWDYVEALAVAYPALARAVHEARASALLREGKFLEALERLRMAGSAEKELAMIQALIDAAVAECKFGMARQLCQQLVREVVYINAEGKFPAAKAIRGRILVFSALLCLYRYNGKVFHAPDIKNVAMLRAAAAAFSGGVDRHDTRAVSVCTFLTCYAALPHECAAADERFLANYESAEFQDQEKTGPAQEQATFINSQTRPQLGSLSYIELGSAHLKVLPSGVPEPAVWLALASASGNAQTTTRALKRLSTARLPQGMSAMVRHRLLAAKTARPQTSYMGDQCPRCGAAIDALPQSQVLMQRDYDIMQALPMCTPVMCDICKCGIPLVRSAISLRVLPLILVEPAEDSSILELIENANSVQIADDNGQVIRVAEGDLAQQLRDAPVVTDGRGVQLPKDSYGELNPEHCFVLEDSYTDPRAVPELVVDGIVRRVYCVNSEDVEVHFCHKCYFFFEAGELEQEMVLGGQCPICGNAELKL